MRKALAAAVAGLAITGFAAAVPSVAHARTTDGPQYVVSGSPATASTKAVFALCDGPGAVPTDTLTNNDTAVDYNLAANVNGNSSLASQPSPISDGTGRTVGWRATFTQAGGYIVVTCEDDKVTPPAP